MARKANLTSRPVEPLLPDAAHFGCHSRFKVNAGLPTCPVRTHTAFHLLQFRGLIRLSTNRVQVAHFRTDQHWPRDARSLLIATARRDELQRGAICELNQLRRATFRPRTLLGQKPTILAGLNRRLDVQFPFVVRHIHGRQTKQHGLLPLKQVIHDGDDHKRQRLP